MWATLLFLVLLLPPTAMIRKFIFPFGDFLSTEGDEEEKISEEAKSLESRFGPQYHNTALQSYSEEQPLNESRFGPQYHNVALQNYSEEQPLNVSVNADLIQGNTAEEIKKEDIKDSAIIAVSSTALAIYLIFMLSLCVVLRRRRIQNGNSWHTFGCSREQQKSAEAGTNAHGSQRRSSDSETAPLINSIDELLTAVASNSSETSLAKDSN
eukprot:XP_025000637.1 uncharacterized protein LOC427369 isoform X2 [Gallus gallus]